MKDAVKVILIIVIWVVVWTCATWFGWVGEFPR